MKEYHFYLIIMILISCLVVLLKPIIKGWFGETAVAVILSRLNPEEYQTINDVIVKTKRGTSQIDHVVISLYGIFVIETKNYKGWITGTDYSEQWTKNMYGKKYKFRNPIIQNYGHVKALEEVLGLNEDSFIPIVVFSNDSELKVKTERPVVYTTKLIKEIRKYSELKFTKEEINELVSKINELNVRSTSVRKEHIKNIKSEIKENNEKIHKRICPKCGGVLVERNGKRGAFLGCKNYPKCKYTSDIK